MNLNSLKLNGYSVCFIVVMVFSMIVYGYHGYVNRVLNTPETWYQMGILSLQENNILRAEKAFQQALRLDPHYKPALLLLAIQAYQENHHRKSKSYFLKLRGEYPENSVLFNKITILLNNSNF